MLNEQIYESPNFNPGGILDIPDSRDYHWDEIGNSLPPYDWNNEYNVEAEIAQALNVPSFQIPNKNQNGSGSCGGQAWSYYGATLEALATKSYEERSAKFIYSQTFVPIPGGGSTGRDNCDLVIKQGFGLESLTPSYENGQPPSEAFMERKQDVTLEAKEKALLSRALSYASVSANIDVVAQAIQYNHGAIILITGTNNGTWSTQAPVPPTDGSKTWNHWLYCSRVGHYNGKKAIGVINSWGENVGTNGRQWITEDYFNARVNGMPCISSLWTLLYNDKPVDNSFTHNFATDIRIGATGSEVIALQKALQITGDYPMSVPITGNYYNITAAAVLKFQIKSGIYPPNQNSVGPKTRAALNQIFNH